MALLNLFSKTNVILNVVKRGEESLEVTKETLRYTSRDSSVAHLLREFRLHRSDIWKGVSFLPLFFFLSSCVPSPLENANVPPEFTDLHSFFTPQKTTPTYFWHHIQYFPHSLTDSIYINAYSGTSTSPSVDGYFPISLFKFSDTLAKDSVIHSAYISDSLVMMYYGNASDPRTQKQTLLRDTLKVGANWIAADNFITENGAIVKIKALVENYYSQVVLFGVTYTDMYAISYTASLNGAQIPTEAQYQEGAHLDIYYAKNSGDIMEICENSKDSIIFQNELIETRIR
jgi:hypothetical protein